MVKGIKRQHEKEQYHHNNQDNNKTSQKDPELEKPRTRWSSGLLAEEINSVK